MLLHSLTAVDDVLGNEYSVRDLGGLDRLHKEVHHGGQTVMPSFFSSSELIDVVFIPISQTLRLVLCK